MATVIKSGELTRPAAAAACRPFNLLDIEAEGRRILADARAQAVAERERILHEARAAAARLEAEAREKGFREGHARGLEEGRAQGHTEAFQQAKERFEREQSGLTEACRNLIYAFDEHKGRLLLAARTDVVRLALAIARRVVRRVEADPARAEAAALAHAAEAIDLVAGNTDITLRVHPQVAEAMQTFAGPLAEASRSGRHVRVTADESVPPGGCVLQTAEGGIDARLETQIDRIAAFLLGSSPETTRVAAPPGDAESREDAPR